MLQKDRKVNGIAIWERWGPSVLVMAFMVLLTLIMPMMYAKLYSSAEPSAMALVCVCQCALESLREGRIRK